MLRRLLFLLLITFVSLNGLQASMDPRVKALGTMALYGTAGGALLGTATLAFGSSGRSVAKGASIGLYTGIIFGSYVVISHAMKKHRMKNPDRDEDYYPDADSPYEDEGGKGIFEARLKTNEGQKWNAARELATYKLNTQASDQFTRNIRFNSRLDLMVPVVHLTF